jgi:hypothetical protein
MPEYRYELRPGDEVIATGHLSSEQPFEVGKRITVGSRSGIVRSIDLSLGKRVVDELGNRICGTSIAGIARREQEVRGVDQPWSARRRS